MDEGCEQGVLRVHHLGPKHALISEHFFTHLGWAMIRSMTALTRNKWPDIHIPVCYLLHGYEKAIS